MNQRMRELSDGELNSVSGGGANIVRSASCGRVVTTITGITAAGQVTYGTSTVPCAAGEFSSFSIAEPGTLSAEVQDMMGGDPCD